MTPELSLDSDSEELGIGFPSFLRKFSSSSSRVSMSGIVELSTDLFDECSYLRVGFLTGGDSNTWFVSALLEVGYSGGTAGLAPLTTEANESLLAWMGEDAGLSEPTVESFSRSGDAS